MTEHQILLENFSQKHLNHGLQWLNEPTAWNLNSESRSLILKTDAQTDFWQKTHYDFQADNGHFLYYNLHGDFRLTTKVKSKPIHRYDQAGLMVRFSSETWLKTSVEHIPDGNSKLGVVVTNQGYSDWSSQQFVIEESFLFYRITRRDDNFYVDYSLDSISWSQIRITHLSEETNDMQVGIYACSPQGEGYEAEFAYIKIESIDDTTEVY
ncbi:DUF1349 domain-containing protein [Radiobacillus sp. PE A8.2]|uniref:DUF1349 domain-containing protein n=1 Tax=Radiobacillus sp. PE A8.2 TaxID=3380349 RepID=UPI00388E7572